jgi:hypothetical protein
MATPGRRLKAGESAQTPGLNIGLVRRTMPLGTSFSGRGRVCLAEKRLTLRQRAEVSRRCAEIGIRILPDRRGRAP